MQVYWEWIFENIAFILPILSFYTWQFGRRFADDFGNLDDINFARLENLRAEFLNFLVRIDVAVSKELKTFVETGEKQNCSTHDHYSKYYDDDLRLLIEDNDLLFVEKFGYTF